MNHPMLLPRPTSVRRGDGSFLLDDSTALVAAPEVRPEARWLQSALRPATGLDLPLADRADRAVELRLDDGLGPEAYRLDATPQGVVVTGGDRAGVFHGCQSLLQLLPAAVFRRAEVSGVPWAVPEVAVTDAPRFAWRGTMLDVARHFMPKHDVLRFLDLMAMHRLNTLHLHLTDDQGWRVQILRYPRLTEVGAGRSESQRGATADAPGDGRPHGGFYTQDDIREIVAYAARRHITVVPEIDVPGHSQAAIAAYPELGVGGGPSEVWTRWGVNPHVLNTEESTVAFYRGVLDEIMDLFPGPVVGVGGDECPTIEWREDPRTQRLMRERGLRHEHELRSWFVRQLGAHVAARGRRLFGWDELLEDEVPPGTVVASWRGMTGAVTAARRGLHVVSCPDDQVYLDYRQSDGPDEPIPVSIPITVEKAYAFDPVPAGLTPEEGAHVLGGQANIWTEHMDSPRTVDYFAFPRLCAVAEALWSTGERRYEEFRPRLEHHLAHLDAYGVEYRPVTGPHLWQTRPGIPGRPSTEAEREAFIDVLVAGIKDPTP
ncbi:beta-N-acetylhexosaminidase [Streptomyces antnestii]|uniref:beta-N-acetylhexosaminidase n=1 Tax=Streptomyces antnestii TaxID=2494256 RepID=A0A3S2YT62_9ACTN|nr:beta-N-acetylhexosaminidase [Streptomyces sp. San01]RVU18857.1 beta-N-acetylhexosaminidase [Streptomyces sp. San01]